MATPPTFVVATATSYAAAGVGVTTKTTASFSVTLGDILVVYADSEDRAAAALSAISDTGTNSWTSQINVTLGNFTAGFRVWTATAAASTSITVTVTCGTSNKFFGFTVLQFSGSGGLGAISPALTSPVSTAQTTISTLGDNSCLTWGTADWSAINGSSRTYVTITGAALTQDTYDLGSGMGSYVAHYMDTQLAGSKTAGLSAPTGLSADPGAVEVKGTVAGAFDVPLLDPTQIRQFNVYRM